MVDAADVLLDDRPGVEVGGDVVARRADEFHTARERLMVGARSDEAREEAVVDVDGLACPPIAQLRRHDLHETSQDDGIGVEVVDDRRHLREGSLLVARGERHVMERHAEPRREALEVTMIADDGLDAGG
ncbi:Uncharacterised protein [Mycobacteroides abscessus subsp. abscessus]|nr:Uncharacterised protein [Mycobacteroides abscessus subsp. abscessus]